ncbi:hypothetical protein ACTXI0_02370 [Arthrobacter rhombi]|uniref:hypothetical protein n=1 Tax=Micrococcaceae TaxID=1268 RepID=UPI000BB6D893|nr:hypothetical protein [Glutamicibacter sp. BW78]PCC24738.1 hypothetical protein CIK75_11210 [Glutamicibacter sp. BW78]
MPADWYSPVLVFLGTAAWPAAFLLAMWLFRSPIGRFIDEITQLEIMGNKATRSGNQLSESLRQDALEGLGGVEGSADPGNTPKDDVAGAAVAQTQYPSFTQRKARQNAAQSEADEKSEQQLLQFLGDQIYQKLLNTKRQDNTRSPAVSAELVRTAYSDLRLGVRYLGQHRLGADKISGSSWPLASADEILKRLKAPQEQIDLTRQIRRLEGQVKSKAVRVDGRGAGDFVQTAIDIHIAIYEWAGIEVQATRRRPS